MGTSYYAYAIIGCEVTGKLYREVEVPTRCEHAGAAIVSHDVYVVNGPQAKFCAQCGKQQSKMELQPIEQYDEENSALNGLIVVWSGYRGNARKDLRSFAGIVVEAHLEGGYVTRMPVPINEFDNRAEMVRDALQEVGMWDPDSFGLWAVLAAG